MCTRNRIVLSIVCLLAAGAGGQPRTYPYFGAREHAVGGRTAAVAFADLNGDGRPDLVATDVDNHQVRVFINSGGDLDVYAPSYPTGAQPYAVVCGDINRDGWQDVLVGCNGARAVSVLLGNGDGSLQPAYSVPTMGYTQVQTPLAIADANGDGKLDLLCSDYFSGNVLRVIPGDGAGGFGAPIDTAITGAGPVHDIVFADFDADGDPDAAVTRNLSLYIYLNGGSGAFSLAQGFTYSGAGASPKSMATGDMNDDGVPDLAVGVPGRSEILLFTGVGDGSFVDQPAFATGFGASPDELAMRDLDDNGWAELFYGGTDNGVTAVVHNPLGPVRNTVGTYLTLYNHGMAFADVDGDGRDELAIANWNRLTAAVLAIDGSGALPAWTNGWRYASAAPVRMSVGDANLDGFPEIAVTLQGEGTWDQAAGVFRNDGTGHLDGPWNENMGMNRAASVLLVDLNPNLPEGPCPDLVVVGANGGNCGSCSRVSRIGLRAGLCDQHFSSELALYQTFSPEIFDSRVIDWNNDGYSDIAIAEVQSDLDAHPVVEFLINQDGTGLLVSQLGGGVSESTYVDMQVADIDQDGDEDLLVLTDGGGISSSRITLMYNPDIDPKPYGSFDLGQSRPSGLALGDFDDDGDLDAVVSDEDGQFWLLVNHGDGALDFEYTVDLRWKPGNFGGQAVDIAAGDLTGDGIDDVAVLLAEDGGEHVRLYPSRGDTTFGAPYWIATRTSMGAAANPVTVEIADLDADGWNDLLVGNEGPFSGLVVYRNRGPAEPPPCVGDFNDDGAVNTQDVVAFLNAWVAGNSEADINGDGVVDIQDVLGFLNAWVAGCP
ncbi:MAG: VCBS repeat-containing protein [Phycisphaerales bacterium]|nr:VCBS repeat-containing protein [Phycisphaerales bacterium]